MSTQTMKSKTSRMPAGEPPVAAEDVVDRLAGLLAADELQDALKGLEPEETQAGRFPQPAGGPCDRDGARRGAYSASRLSAGPGSPGWRRESSQWVDPEDVQSQLGPVAVNTPRDRAGTFEPQLVGKRQTRLAGLDKKILGLYAGGMSVRDIESHLHDLYGVDVGRDTISRVTGAILEDVQAWRTRPLERVYPIAYFDCLMVKVREHRSVQNRACYLAIGVSLEGERGVLGIWRQDTEGAKFWLAVLNDLHQRGVQDVLVCCVDGLNGFPDAIEVVFPKAWVQSCIVHYAEAAGYAEVAAKGLQSRGSGVAEVGIIRSGGGGCVLHSRKGEH